ncbi:MAG: AraC family transcriptional regulator [Bacteroidales bacterium]|nr:AraC family transcriptional regulator [Bacteroidales bacterium]
MYSLKEAWLKMHGELPFDGWDGKMYCNVTDKAITFRANRTQGFMAAYTFTLVTRGWLSIKYNGRELTLQEDDIYMYSPGLEVTIVSASRDYKGICLLADEQLTFGATTIRDMVQLAYRPVVQLQQPKIHLPHQTALQLFDRMSEISRSMHSDNINKAEIVKLLYSVFLLDLQNAQDKAVEHPQVPKRVEEIFIEFIRLLPRHFAQHHDIAFYASALNISTTYLSRVVRQVSSRTVVDYINQFLIMEASFLLRTSQLSISQIADKLNFSDIASFSKFFTRHKGISPKVYRDDKTK